MRLFTIIAEKTGNETILLQEDADNEVIAFKNAMGRLPANFVDDSDLPIVCSVLEGQFSPNLLKMPREHSIWTLANSSSLALSFRVIVIKTVFERTKRNET